ncbi:MAG TPA: SRPBCC domain-containing protein [Thermoanaerobaculia bacterium]|nr:SRPBCC domain-containing protein [Thermoanaerobaculia bacterium]
MDPAPAVTTEDKELEFEFTRLLHAPRALVFAAWTDPGRLSQWFGPRGFTTPVCQVDARVGGAYRIVMRSPEGRDYPLKGVFRELVRPELLVMTMDTSEHPADWFADLRKAGGVGSTRPDALVVTVTFDDEGGKTRLRVRSRFLEKADRDAHLKMGASEGWSQSFERLAELLGVRMETR